MSDHPSLYAVILFPKVATASARPSVPCNSFEPETLDCRRALVITADAIDDKPIMAIHTAVDVKYPSFSP
jgi:hypothetical protein